MPEIIHSISLHERGETPMESSLRVLKAANQLGLDGYRIAGLKEVYTLGDQSMDVLVEHVGKIWVLNEAGSELVQHDVGSAAGEVSSAAPDATYEIAADGASIKCLTCGHTSHNPQDVEQRYCGYCHVFHPTCRGRA